MALTKRVAKVDKTAPSTAGKVRTTIGGGVRLPLPKVSLATEPNEPATAFDSHVLYIHAAPGVGKTSLTAEFPKVHQFMVDPGALFLPTYQKPINHWLEMPAYADKFGESDFQWATIDVVEEAYELCFEFMCSEVLKIDHPTDEKDYGKSWNAIYTEFVRQHLAFKKDGRGVIYVSHSRERLFKPAFGESYEMIRPSLSSNPLDRLLGKVDVMGYLYRDPKTNRNRMRIQPDGTVMAKTRPTTLFLYTDGTRIEEIDMGCTPKEGFEQYRRAFNNELVRPKPTAAVASGLRKAK